MSEHAAPGAVEPEGEVETSDVEFDAEAHAAESAEHDTFLETYAPVITRLPQAILDESAEQREAEEAAAALVAQRQAEADELARQQLEHQQKLEADEAAYRQEHYPE